MSKTPRTDEARDLDNGESCYVLDLAEQLETELYDACREISSLRDQRSALGLELGMIKTVFREYVKAEDKWMESLSSFCSEDMRKQYRVEASELREKAKEVLGL